MINKKNCEIPVIVFKTLELIKKQIGLDLVLCDYFTGVKLNDKRYYFNVILNKRISDSKDYEKLKNFADKYKIISVEPNGLKRVAICLNNIQR